MMEACCTHIMCMMRVHAGVTNRPVPCCCRCRRAFARVLLRTDERGLQDCAVPVVGHNSRGCGWWWRWCRQQQRRRQQKQQRRRGGGGGRGRGGFSRRRGWRRRLRGGPAARAGGHAGNVRRRGRRRLRGGARRLAAAPTSRPSNGRALSPRVGCRHDTTRTHACLHACACDASEHAGVRA